VCSIIREQNVVRHPGNKILFLKVDQNMEQNIEQKYVRRWNKMVEQNSMYARTKYGTKSRTKSKIMFFSVFSCYFWIGTKSVHHFVRRLVPPMSST